MSRISWDRRSRIQLWIWIFIVSSFCKNCLNRIFFRGKINFNSKNCMCVRVGIWFCSICRSICRNIGIFGELGRKFWSVFWELLIMLVFIWFWSFLAERRLRCLCRMERIVWDWGLKMGFRIVLIDRKYWIKYSLLHSLFR